MWLELVQGLGDFGRIDVLLMLQEPLPDLFPQVTEAAKPACQFGALVRSSIVLKTPSGLYF